MTLTAETWSMLIESVWYPNHQFMVLAPIFLMEMDSLIPQMIQASFFMEILTLSQSMVWLVCMCHMVHECWWMHFSYNKSFFQVLVNLTSNEFMSLLCSFSSVLNLFPLSPCRSSDSLCMGSGTSHVPHLSLHTYPSRESASFSESGWASQLVQCHCSRNISAVSLTGFVLIKITYRLYS